MGLSVLKLSFKGKLLFSPYTELVEAKTRCLILLNLLASNILKKPLKLLSKIFFGMRNRMPILLEQQDE